jgi:hypothetical protein
MDGQTLATKGRERLTVQGSERSETFTVMWEKPSPSAPITIVRMEGNAGEKIRP